MADATVPIGYILENYTSLYNADPGIVSEASEALGEEWADVTSGQVAEVLGSFKALMKMLQGGTSSE